MPAHPSPPLDYQSRQDWRATGNVRVRVGWFGRLILEEEHQRYFSTLRAGDGYSPGFWQCETSWRRAPRGAVLPIEGGAT